MKKIMKILVYIFGPIILVVNRVFSFTAESMTTKNNPIGFQVLYGVVAPTKSEIVIGIIKDLVIPVAFIIFLFFGIRKKMKNKKKMRSGK